MNNNHPKNSILRFFAESILVWSFYVGLSLSSSPLSAQSHTTQQESISFKPPITNRIASTHNLHGVEMTDYYEWLEDKTNADVVAWTKKQHDATVDYLQKTRPEIRGLRQELTALFDRDVTSPPRFKADREFFTRRNKGDKHTKYYTRIQGKEVLLFDPNTFDPSGLTAVSSQVYNKDASKLAIGLQHKGSEINEFIFLDTKTAKEIHPRMSGVSSLSWARNNDYVYVVYRDKESIDKQTPLPCYLHKLGTPRSEDKEMMTTTDAKISCYAYDSEDADVTVFGKGDFYSNTVMFRPIGSDKEPKVLYSSTKHRAFPAFEGDRIYWMTNDGAPNFKILLSTLKAPEFDKARTLVPEGNTVIETFELTKRWLLVQDKKDIISRIKVYDLDGKFIQDLELPEVADVGYMSYHKESDIIYVSLSSFTSPSKLYKLDGKTLEWTFFYQDKPPVDLSDIEAKIEFVKSKDGTKVPIFLIHKKGIKLDGKNPALLYGYGGFNVGIKPSFVGYTSSFLKRGGVLVNAGIRGGDEYGEKWHQDGMLAKKQNSFDDFIAVAEWMIAKKYCSPSTLVAQGGSNGGLLMGAMAVQRPELFKAIVCQVPLLDMLRYHKFQIARFWIPEYGDPDKKEDFEILRSYSPYHNISASKQLPTMLVSAGAQDTRVDPLHAKKFVALAQSNPMQKNPVMLWIDYNSGHGSGKSIQDYINDQVINWTFIMREAGITE